MPFLSQENHGIQEYHRARLYVLRLLSFYWPTLLICITVIATAFTISTIVNRQRSNQPEHNDIEANAYLSTEKRSPSPPAQSSYSRTVKTLPQRLLAKIDIDKSRDNTWASKLLAKFPFILEICYWNLTYWPYQLLRAFSAKQLRGHEAPVSIARQHAMSILNMEYTLGIAIERPLQQYVLNNIPWLISILGKIYHSHILVGVCFIVYTYTFIPPRTHERIRRTIAIDNFIAFAILSMWRCMPPRLLPEEYNFVDILHKNRQQGSIWSNNRFQLTIAAMPSLHFGTAFFFAFCLCRYSPHRWLRVLAPLWPIAMFVTIIATAHHFVLDAVVGAMVSMLGWKINRIWLALEPVEIWILSLFSIEKPTRSSEEFNVDREDDIKRYH
ncbi:integral membrane protein [Xylogone sp. PMI_703]|nr:integral membrane protein [Xylogone sp. PMI_703]